MVYKWTSYPDLLMPASSQRLTGVNPGKKSWHMSTVIRLFFICLVQDPPLLLNLIWFKRFAGEENVRVIQHDTAEPLWLTTDSRRVVPRQRKEEKDQRVSKKDSKTDRTFFKAACEDVIDLPLKLVLMASLSQLFASLLILTLATDACCSTTNSESPSRSAVQAFKQPSLPAPSYPV